MMIIGVDYHPSFHTIAFLIEETGECGERELNHSDGEAERFYRELKERGVSVRVGMEATPIHAGSSDYLQSWVSSCGLVASLPTAAAGVRSGMYGSGYLQYEMAAKTLLIDTLQKS